MLWQKKFSKSERLFRAAIELIEAIKKGDKIALSRAITLVESTNPEHLEQANEVIKGCLPYANKSSSNWNYWCSWCWKKYVY